MAEKATTTTIDEKDKITENVDNAENENNNSDVNNYNFDPLPRKAHLMFDEGYMKERVDGQIAYYDAKSSENRDKYKKLKKIEFFIASSVPVLVTFSTTAKGYDIPIIKLPLDTVIQIIAAIGGVIVVIMNKLLELGEHQNLWKTYRQNAEALKQEKYMYMTRTEPYDEDDAFPMFVEKIESILGSELQRWKSSNQQNNKKALSQATAAMNHSIAMNDKNKTAAQKTK